MFKALGSARPPGWQESHPWSTSAIPKLISCQNLDHRVGLQDQMFPKSSNSQNWFASGQSIIFLLLRGQGTGPLFMKQSMSSKGIRAEALRSCRKKTPLMIVTQYLFHICSVSYIVAIQFMATYTARFVWLYSQKWRSIEQLDAPSICKCNANVM